VLLNSRHISELIEKGDLNAIKEAMEQSLSPGSQTFEQALHALYRAGAITLDEALANADSANNLHWLINNTELALKTEEKPRLPLTEPEAVQTTTENGASFAEFTLKLE
jgi:twitching motility protein PilU